ncbi:MAG: alanine--tRNA ligase, partial [Acidimicrobiia bacterium]|nr:alanine--tRNA ligase [Acidimicrobiia bacterium]
YVPLIGGLEATSFLGYETGNAAGRVLAIVRDGELVDEAGEGQDVEVFLDSSPFYAESGGQVGDSGSIVSETGTVRVDDTQFSLPGIHGHRGTVAVGTIKVGQDTEVAIDSARRERIRKNHTGTHILHWALRDIIGDHVQQAGSLVAPDRLRFDFSHYEAPDPDVLVGVEEVTNHRVISNDAVTTVETSKQEAEAMGALAFFGDKYGEDVRVVRTGDYSVEFCGGTHVTSTGQVGPVVVLSEGSVGANLRRMEALTGVSAYEHLVAVRQSLTEAEGILRAQPGQLLTAARTLTERVDDVEQRLATFESRARSQAAGGLADSAESHGEWGLVVAEADVDDADSLRMLALQIREKVTGIGVLGAAIDGKGSLIAYVSPELAARGVSAGELIADAAREMGGGGSRDPELAQAGGPRGDQVGAALEKAREVARAALMDLE